MAKASFFERGVYVSERLKKTDNVLDLCCGDGSVSALFIAPLVKKVIAVDFDPSAIKTARQRYGHSPNAVFEIQDIRKLPYSSSSFDCITWDCAIEHFTELEIDSILKRIHELLTPEGFLTGSTIEAHDEGAQHHDHEFEFDNEDQVKSFLSKYFKTVEVWSRQHDKRVNIYFRAWKGNARR